MPTITCSGCGARLRTPGEPSASTLPCPKCGTAIRVRQAGPPPVPAATERPEPPPRRRERAERDNFDDDRDADREPARPARGRDKGAKGKRKKRRGGSDRRKFLILGGAAAGGVFVLVAIAVAGWLLFGRSGGGPAGATGADAPIAVAAARPAKGVSAPAIRAAAQPPAAGTWKVAPDGVPAPAGLASAYTVGSQIGPVQKKEFSVQTQWPTARVLFARPDSGQAAVLVGTRWFRYDLRKPPHPVAVVDAARPGGQNAGPPRPWTQAWELADLSPDGTRLAGTARLVEGLSSAVGVMSLDGGQIMEARERHPEYFLWAGFLDDARLAVLTANGGLEVRDVSSGAVASRIADGWKPPVAFSPGRNWVVGFTGDGFEWRRLPGGEVGGTLRLPPGAPAPKSAPGSAVSPDGSSFACYYQGEGQHVILTWDVATGAIKDVVLYPASQSGAPLETASRDVPVQWAGPRAVLIAGQYVVDLDLGVPVWQWARNRADYSDRIIPGPDGRFWRAGPLPDGDKLWDQLAGKAPNPPPKEQATFLFAGSPLSPAAATHAGNLRAGVVLTYNHPIRAEAQGANAEFRTAVADALAGYLTGQDFLPAGEAVPVRYAVDPGAAQAVRVRLPPPEVKLYREVLGAVAVVGGQRAEGPGSYRPEVVVTGRLEIVDRAGKVIWTSSRVMDVSEPITAAYGRLDEVKKKYPEATNVPDQKPAPVDVEAKYAAQLAAARQRFLAKLGIELRNALPRGLGPLAGVYLSAGLEPTRPWISGEMAVDGLPPAAPKK